MPCSKGKPNAQGNLCPYAEHEPQTVEGWEAWDIALRCAGQLRVAGLLVTGIDMVAVIKIAEALGYSLNATADLISSNEIGIVQAFNKRLQL
ncbi:MAG: hypothetical protein ABTQ34_09735 [Bdellovibrionales bacterium]